MKLYADKFTVWDCGEPLISIECVDGCARLQLHNQFWTSETWQQAQQLVYKAIKTMETEQQELECQLNKC